MDEGGLLWSALRAAHAHWSCRLAEGFPPAIEWEPPAGAVGAEKGQLDQQLKVAVPTGPTVPTDNEDIDQASPLLTPEQEERAAILEFEAGLDRATAERLAQLSAVSD